MKLLVELIQNNPALKVLTEGRGKIVTSYLNDEAYLVAGAFWASKQSYVIVKSNLYEANQFYTTLKTFLQDDCYYYPFDEAMRMEVLAESPEMLAERLNCYEALRGNQPLVIVTHTNAILRHVPSFEIYEKNRHTLKVGMRIDMHKLQETLVELGYQYILNVDQPFYFSHRGGIIDVYSINYEHPIRIEFFDDEIDSLRFFDETTQRTIESVQEVTIIPATELLYDSQEVPGAVEKLEALYTKCVHQLEPERQEDLENYFEIDMENLRHHDTSPSMYKYYAAFNHSSSILNFRKNMTWVLSSYSGVKENEKLLNEEMFSYQIEMFKEGRMIRGLNPLFELEDLLAKNKQIVEIENFKSKPSQVVFNARSIDSFYGSTQEDIVKRLREFLVYAKVLVVLENEHLLRKISDLCEDHHIAVHDYKQEGYLHQGVNLLKESLNTGIDLGDEKVVVLTGRELFGHGAQKKKTFIKYKNAKVLKNFEDLQIGDYIVHDTHGIGQYLGIKTLTVGENHKDYLYIAYRGNDVLYIPVEQFKLIRKYTSKEGRVPKVNKLGSTEWAKTKQRIKKKTDDIAEKLIEIYAERMARPGFAFGQDGPEQLAFEQEFGYALTKDQEIAVQEIKHDMQEARPMDRLLCGDVGFGKTEVALRAAFKAIESGKQVAFLCPTTILANQHYKTMQERFKSFPIEVAMLNRYVPKKQQKDILEKLQTGRIDIVVGTHRILSKDVKFKDIGLLVIDEEQRFGVRHKEKIKEMKQTIDVLTLTATPIPRTLQMSLMGIRGLSTINTPPKNRFPVQTFVIEKSPTMLKQIIERELARDGQVFYLYNRTEDINRVASEIARTIPNAKVGVGHGKMDKNDLEDVMDSFIKKEFNILVCTTIIETGIDIPNANTMIVEDADYFGLSQLYQIKGRVGRSSRHAYAYLLHRANKQMTPEATKRLKAIKEFTELGSGYKIAMRDLNIRGAGDILGGEQAGFIDTVGFDMFMRILQESINEKTGKVKEEEKEVPTTSVSVDAYIPEAYVNSDLEKLRLYQQLHQANSLEQLEATKSEFTDLYGKLPREVNNLVLKREFDILATHDTIEKISENNEEVEVLFTKEASLHIDGTELLQLVTQLSKAIRIAYRFSQVSVKFPKVGNFFETANLFLKQIERFIN
jgi:transcription-repair coupling factor (mfd)